MVSKRPFVRLCKAKPASAAKWITEVKSHLCIGLKAIRLNGLNPQCSLLHKLNAAVEVNMNGK